MKAFITLLLFATSCVANTSEEFLISYFEHPQIEKYKDVVKKSYEDIGISIKFINIEGERAYRTLDQGVTDAEMLIEKSVADKYPNILMVKPLLVEASFYLLCEKSLPCNRRVLHQSDNQVFVEQITDNHFPEIIRSEIKAELIPFTSLEALLELIARGRTQYAIYAFEKDTLTSRIKLNANTVKIYDAPAFHGVHTKHKAIIPALEKALLLNLSLVQ